MKIWPLHSKEIISHSGYEEREGERTEGTGTRTGRDRKEAEGDDHKADCLLATFRFPRRQLPPYSSLLSNIQKWRPELQSTPSDQLASPVFSPS